MKKLRIILLCSVLIYVYYITNNLIYKSNYKEGNITLEGYIIDISYSDKITLTIKSKEKIRVTYYGDIELKLGDYVKISGLLEKPSSNTVFNLYNYRLYLMSNKIYFNLKANNIVKIKDNTNLFYKIKNNMYERVNNLKSGSYLKTFILGDKSDLGDIKTIYQENGISHLMAISGMHVSLFASILDKILKKVKKRHFIISIFLLFYAFLTNFTPSVIRAVVLFIFNKFNEKNLLIVLAFVMLLYNPYYIYNTGFLFSFIISLYLILFSHLINRFDNYFIKIFITSLICFMVSIPIMINNFYYINLTSPLINVIFVPFISIIIFPLCLLTLILPFFDNVLYLLVNILENLSIFFNYFNIEIILAKTPFYIIILYYLLITLISMKPKYFYLLIIILLIHTNIKYFNSNYYLTTLDVGQGDSNLIELGTKVILIDTGGIVNSDYSLADNRLIPYFKSIGIKKIDYMILTHGDYDHMGEAINLVENFKVEKVIFNCGEFNDLEQELIRTLDKKKIPYYSCIKELNIDKNKLYFLQTNLYDNENDNSNVIYTELNGYKFTFMGDASITTEKEILKEYNLPDVDVLKVGHHGSKTSSGKEFINEINPKYSIISVGKNNRYGHPNKEVLDNLNDSKVYRTDQDGSIMFKIKNNKLKIETCSP